MTKTQRRRVSTGLSSEENDALLSIRPHPRRLSLAWLGRRAVVKLLEEYERDGPSQLLLPYPISRDEKKS